MSDTFRRRSHRTRDEHRTAQLEELIRRILRSYKSTVELHDDCSSCGTDLAIFQREAAKLRITDEGVA